MTACFCSLGFMNPRPCLPSVKKIGWRPNAPEKSWIYANQETNKLMTNSFGRKPLNPKLLMRDCLLLSMNCLLTCASSTQAQATSRHGRISVLYVGNSYTYQADMPAMVSAMAGVFPESTQIHGRAVVEPGATLEDHWQSGAVRQAIRERKWDFVVLQEHSRRPFEDPKRMLHFGRLLGEQIQHSGAQTVLFLTWPRQTQPETMGALAKSYRALAQELGATIAPVGPAWVAALRHLPASALYEEDGSHPTRFGSYLAACVFYLVLQNHQRSCPNLQAGPLSAAELNQARTAAREAIHAEKSNASIQTSGRPRAR